MEHVVHVVEHVEVRVLPEMICGPFSRVPGWDKMISETASGSISPCMGGVGGIGQVGQWSIGLRK